MSEVSNVKIVSDGTSRRTRVTVGGVEVKGLRRITFAIDAADQVGIATFEVFAPEFDGTLEEWVITKPAEGDA